MPLIRKRLAAVAMLIAALGIGVMLGLPSTASAQEDTGTTVVEQTTEESASTETTEESTDESSEDTDRPAREGHDCDEEDTSAEETNSDL